MPATVVSSAFGTAPALFPRSNDFPLLSQTLRKQYFELFKEVAEIYQGIDLSYYQLPDDTLWKHVTREQPVFNNPLEGL